MSGLLALAVSDAPAVRKRLAALLSRHAAGPAKRVDGSGFLSDAVTLQRKLRRR
ncbi:MAG TPA: hypothetical protein VFL60_08380 [Gaiellaceae bacterium]|nr:hypothetical protein [Gaiellaceae bacterium]